MPSLPRLRLLFAAFAAALAAVIAAATTVVPPEFPALVNDSDYIVRARVVHVAEEVQIRDGREVPFTLATLDVVEVIAGTPPTPLVLRQLGGRTSDGELVVAGVPRFRVGDEDILFVSGNGRNFHPLTALGHGRYPVRFDKKLRREYVARANGVPLAATAAVALPLVEGKLARQLRAMRRADDALTPVEFVQSIRAARAERTPGGPNRAR